MSSQPMPEDRCPDGSTQTLVPRGFVGIAARVGIKDTSRDFALVASEAPGTTSAAVYTQSRFAGASVQLNRAVSSSAFRGIVAMPKNANVATGDEGIANAIEVRERAAALVGCQPEELLGPGHDGDRQMRG